MSRLRHASQPLMSLVFPPSQFSGRMLPQHPTTNQRIEGRYPVRLDRSLGRGTLLLAIKTNKANGLAGRVRAVLHRSGTGV
jgi:hypothetical protein